MKTFQTESYQVAVVQWTDDDEISAIICDELLNLGHHPRRFRIGSPILDDVEVVFSFAPYGKFLQIPYQLGRIPDEYRPTLVHWNTEGIPDLRIPWPMMSKIGACRSWMGRIMDTSNRWRYTLTGKSSISWEHSRMLRFRYIGDYYYAHKKGWLDIFADSSAIYAKLHRQNGLPTIFAPWGATRGWYDDLKLERDINVLWMGQQGSKRRKRLLDGLRCELRNYGIEVYVADNEERPFIFGEARTEILNRAKITLNLTRTWYDDNFSRFAMAAPNRSLIVSEPLLPHCPQWQTKTHYVSTDIDKLVETIVYYLENEAERRRIVENAYRLVTTELNFQNSIKAIMDAVYAHRRRKIVIKETEGGR